MKKSKVDFKTSAMLNGNVSALMNIDSVLPFNYNLSIKATKNRLKTFFINNI